MPFLLVKPELSFHIRFAYLPTSFVLRQVFFFIRRCKIIVIVVSTTERTESAIPKLVITSNLAGCVAQVAIVPIVRPGFKAANALALRAGFDCIVRTHQRPDKQA
jgi:hypothetical protein